MHGVGSGTFSANSDLQPDRCRQLSAIGGFSSKGVVKLWAGPKNSSI